MGIHSLKGGEKIEKMAVDHARTAGVLASYHRDQRDGVIRPGCACGLLLEVCGGRIRVEPANCVDARQLGQGAGKEGGKIPQGGRKGNGPLRNLRELAGKGVRKNVEKGAVTGR